MRVIYHLVARGDWDERAASVARAPSIASDGSVVCAGPDAYVDLANRLFAGRQDVLLLFVDARRLVEPSRAGTMHGVPVVLHPAPLPVDAVFEVAALPKGDAGFVAHHETRALAARGDDTFADVRERALRAMAGWGRPWWVAGGWALDLHVGRESRPHADLELSVLAADQAALHAHLRGWDLRAVAPGATLVPWSGDPLAPPRHQIWARQGTGPVATHEEFSADPTMLDFLVEDHAGDEWRYRRDHRVARAVRDVGSSRDGLPYVRPEIALLYKAKQPRHKDREDFRRVAPLLDREARVWLRAALDAAHPAHPWSAALDAGA